MDSKTITLKRSGRVLLLTTPPTPEELAEINTPEGQEFLEAYADRMERRAARVLTDKDPEYHQILKQHKIEPNEP